MFFRQVLNDDLGCASYVIADAGEAVVVDPKWDVEEYLELAGRHGFQITLVAETHAHADHFSGAPRLVAATGASVAVPRGSGIEPAHRQLADGETIDVGSVRLTVIATPGHRPEHLSFLARERGHDSVPALLLSGDSLLVGEVARPDLAAEDADALDVAARSLFRSLQRLLKLDDFVEVWPGHLGGSLCGGGRLSPRSSSTLGYERRTNPMLAIESEELFTRRVLRSLPARPPHVERTVALNRRGHSSHVEDDRTGALSATQVRKLLSGGAALIDGRPPKDFASGHIPGSLNVPSAQAGFATRCASLVDPDVETIVLGRSNEDGLRMASLLRGVAFTSVRGMVQDGLAGWSRGGRGFDLAWTPSIAPAEVAAFVAAGRGTVLDVRELDEWERGHVAESIHIPWAQLPERLDEVRSIERRPIVVACASGFRAAMAASFLRARAVAGVRWLHAGGVPSLVALGIELRTSEPPRSAPSAIRYEWPAGAAVDRIRRAAR